MFNGLNMHLGNLSRLSNAVTRFISTENFNGEPGKGGMATEGARTKAALESGQAWKFSPCITLQPHTFVTLAVFGFRGREAQRGVNRRDTFPN